MSSQNEKNKIFSKSQVFEADQRDLVIWLDFVIITGIGESERQQALLLQIGLVYTSKTLHNNGPTAQVSGLQSSMFSRASLAIIVVADGHPSETF
ncbi:hypothetical protein BpHYR1_053751 [Brachionus plicatilis]|uniref:Uncharacterized protein n=1 Tax=Brachionus plicatilis TaxID=10195 RepID=A0A3M7R7J4_BRAPC|nr:hypothetical protein BpHYR1_053751 [Brachionus plicatilis]